MYATAEPQALEVLLKGQEILTLTVALIFLIKFFHHATNLKIVASILIEENVASPKSRFLQMVDEGFLLQTKCFKTFHIVTEHLNVGKALVQIIETFLLLTCVTST